MKHHYRGRKLSRSTTQRKALFKNLIIALVSLGRIKTTEAKAKTVKSLVDKLITKAKQGTVFSRRLLLAFLGDKHAANRLVDQIAPRYHNRSSGFTRLLRLGRRRGDDAMMVNLELLDSQTPLPTLKKSDRGTSLKTAKQPRKSSQPSQPSGRQISSPAPTRPTARHIKTPTVRTTHK